MLITHDMLIKIAQDNITRVLARPNDLVAVYLTGSMLSKTPLIGNAGDIDLVFVHKEEPPLQRTIQRISSDISLDIQHHHQSFYSLHRRLRQNPWLGHTLCEHRSILFDQDHWLEFIQAGVGAQFNSSDSRFARAAGFIEQSHTLWFALEDPEALPFAIWIDLYFKAITNSANSIAALNGPALSTRRMMTDFPVRAKAIEQPALIGDLFRLIGADRFSIAFYQEALPAWEACLQSVSRLPNCPPNLLPARKSYFLNAANAYAEEGLLHASLWILLDTWCQAAEFAREDSTIQNAWLNFLQSLDFTSTESVRLVSQVDAFMSQCNRVLEEWKQENKL